MPNKGVQPQGPLVITKNFSLDIFTLLRNGVKTDIHRSLHIKVKKSQKREQCNIAIILLCKLQPQYVDAIQFNL